MLLKTNQNFSPQSYRVCRLFAFGWHCVRRHNRFTFLHHTVLPHLLCVAFLRCKPFTIYFIFVSLLCGVFFIPIYSVIWCILSLAIFTIHLLCVHNVYTQSPLDECFYILLVEHLDQIVWGKVFPQNTLPMHIRKECSEKKTPNKYKFNWRILLTIASKCSEETESFEIHDRRRLSAT